MSLRQFADRFASAVQKAIPGATQVEAVDVEDPALARVTWMDSEGEARRWFVYPAYDLYLKSKGAPEDGIAHAIRSLLNSIDCHDEPEEEARPRSAVQVAQRLLALAAVVSRAHEAVPTRSLRQVHEHGIDVFMSAAERPFYFLDRQPDPQAVRDFSWRAEAMVPLLWALGGLDALPPLDQQIDVWAIPLLQQAVQSPAAFIESARLRPEATIAEQEEHHYHQHWRVRDAQLHRRHLPKGLDAGIVYERRYALSWLVGHGDDWDHVPTDT